MSFILDALKKAESEHSRQAGPVLMDVRIAPKRQRLPAWAWILGCVLLANLLMLAWLLFRHSSDAPAQVAVTTPTAVTTPDGGATVAPVPVPAPAPALASDPQIVQPPAAPIAAPAVAAVQPALQTPIPAAPLPSPAPGATTPIDLASLPTMQELIANGVTLPALQLNLHVYDEVPANRFVLVNSRRMREGNEVDGIRVERITDRGVVLDVRGRRFLLLP